MSLTLQHQGTLVEPIDHTIPGNLVCGASESRQAGEQIRDVDDVSDNGICLDHAGPTSKGIDTNTAFRRVPLAPAEDHRREAATRRVFGEVTVVAHHDDQRVVGNPQFVHFVEDLTDPAIELLHALYIGATIRGRKLFNGMAWIR